MARLPREDAPSCSSTASAGPRPTGPTSRAACPRAGAASPSTCPGSAAPTRCPRATTRCRAHADTVAAFLGTLDEPVHLVGNSLGGAVALAVAAEPPATGAHDDAGQPGGPGPAARPGAARRREDGPGRPPAARGPDPPRARRRGRRHAAAAHDGALLRRPRLRQRGGVRPGRRPRPPSDSDLPWAAEAMQRSFGGLVGTWFARGAGSLWATAARVADPDARGVGRARPVDLGAQGPADGRDGPAGAAAAPARRRARGADGDPGAWSPARSSAWTTPSPTAGGTLPTGPGRCPRCVRTCPGDRIGRIAPTDREAPGRTARGVLGPAATRRASGGVGPVHRRRRAGARGAGRRAARAHRRRAGPHAAAGRRHHRPALARGGRRGRPRRRGGPDRR